MVPYFIILVCLILSAFFSAAETAITSLGILKAKHMLESRGKEVEHLKFWLKHPARVLTTILVFNTVVNILASSIATQLAYEHFKSGAVGIATGAITFFVLVFGEIIPKSFAKAHYERLSIVSLRFVLAAYYAGYPVVRSLASIADIVIRLASHGRQHIPLITEDELEFIVSEGEKAGIIGDIKKNIIEGAFDFDETKVREIMTPRTDIRAFSVETPLQEMIGAAMDTGYSRFPVYRDQMDNVVGIALVKDLLLKAISQPKEVVTAKDVMREAFFAPESKSIMAVFKDLKKTKSHLAVIIDEYGGTAGIVTMEDILEEIVGEIQDEYDVEQAKIIQVDKNTYDVSGSLNIDDFFKFFKLNRLEEKYIELGEDVDTLAGWITQLVGQMPKSGQKVKVAALSMEVLGVKHHRINQVRVRILTPEIEQPAPNPPTTRP